MHKPVLLNEVIEYLGLKPGSSIIDATLNGGGHTMAILEKIAPNGKVLGIEWDPELLQQFKLKTENHKLKTNLITVNDSYVNLKIIIKQYNFHPNGIIFDLGLSSWHYESKRGFSFKEDEYLDMRFNKNDNQLTAADIVNKYNTEELEKIFNEYGEEQFADSIAKNIIRSRRIKPILKTIDLVEIIIDSVPEWYKKRKINPATKTFQALRIEVNGEMANVDMGIRSAIESLVSGGRLVVISFHGLEDKIVREIFKEKAKNGDIRWVKRGTIKPKWEEVQDNRRARSAKMKVVEKL
jgi:16S rRNA (cytosine1402-N4)-methyltransferase